jgi:Icc-related predicted phosphoesterase
LEKAASILERQAGRVWVLPGNHESDVEIAQFCSRHEFRDLHGASLELAGHRIAGLGYSNPTPFNTPGEYSEAEFARRLAPFAALEPPLILICHCPPKDTALDRAGANLHFGSTAIREFIERHQPAYFFCGHIHEAEGAHATLGKTECWNVGKKGHLLEI